MAYGDDPPDASDTSWHWNPMEGRRLWPAPWDSKVRGHTRATGLATH